ncbi:NAD-dependent dehydratase [Opitutus sp. ER46]|uniref:NAD-dependent dehydratase n=1 Tax=Opitutus sp. ER46 TaxID=2161864 RepID=UPI000D30E6E5|nr:NAD-dependent dehydratase [Opitutus sp. ER46]PTX96525.1 NAD-dependent dehydratase [Opitutus sp. ER46]
MPARTLLLFGATGAVGAKVLTLALTDARVARIVAPTRRPLTSAPKLFNPIVDFADLPTAEWWLVDAGINCLGTTRELAGSAEAFERIDRTFVVDAARRTRAAGTPCFVNNSSFGAKASAPTLYLRVKGRLEQDLDDLGFASTTHVRPSLLAHRPEPRPLERVMVALSTPFAFLLPANARPIAVEAVAHTLLEAALAARPGRHVIESGQISRP